MNDHLVNLTIEHPDGSMTVVSGILVGSACHDPGYRRFDLQIGNAVVERVHPIEEEKPEPVPELDLGLMMSPSMKKTFFQMAEKELKKYDDEIFKVMKGEADRVRQMQSKDIKGLKGKIQYNSPLYDELPS